MTTLPFIKMHGLGNDYVYVDCFRPETKEFIARTDLSDLSRRISDRHFGVGSDGLVLIMPSQKADAKMLIFNSDGSEAQMCGNAIRCVAKYLFENQLCTNPHMEIETLSGIRSLKVQEQNGVVEQVMVNMGVPVLESRTLTGKNSTVEYTFVNMGNPHAVFFNDSIEHLPADMNVEFVRVINNKELRVRVIERGSGETLACGTGACASTVAAIHHGWTERNVTVHLPGGDLTIQWADNSSPVFMTGPATEVFRGSYPYSR